MAAPWRKTEADTVASVGSRVRRHRPLPLGSWPWRLCTDVEQPREASGPQSRRSGLAMAPERPKPHLDLPGQRMARFCDQRWLGLFSTVRRSRPRQYWTVYRRASPILGRGRHRTCGQTVQNSGTATTASHRGPVGVPSTSMTQLGPTALLPAMWRYLRTMSALPGLSPSENKSKTAKTAKTAKTRLRRHATYVAPTRPAMLRGRRPLRRPLTVRMSTELPRQLLSDNR